MPNPSIAPTVTDAGSFRRNRFALLTLLLAGACWPATAQATLPPTGPAPLATLRPALATVQATIAGLNIGRWKVPGDARTRAQQDAVSIQRDLSTTLPGLMAQAEIPSSALSPAFAVLRNLDALYDVLLRVAQTAALAGAAADAATLEDARAGLEDGRAKLGAWLLQAISAQDEQIARTATTTAPRAAAPPPSTSRIVVEDGPENPKPRKKKPVPATAPQ